MNKRQPRENNHAVAKILTTLELLGIDGSSLNDMLDELPVTLWMHDENHTIIFGNGRFKETFGGFQKQSCHQCLMGKEKVCSCCPSRRTLENKNPDQCKLCKRGNSGYDLNVFHSTITDKEGRNYFLKSSFHIKDIVTLAKNHFPATEHMAGGEMILVMCASCKRVKDQHENWVDVDNYLVDCFNIHIHHGTCPECEEALYPALSMQDQLTHVTAK